MPSNYLIFCHHLLLLPSIRIFSNELALPIRWPKYWSFNFSLSPSNDYSGLLSFRINWFDLFVVQGTLKSLLQHHNLKASSFLVLSLLYGPTLISVHDYLKNHSFDYMDICWQSDVSAFNMLSQFVIAFLPRSKCLNFIVAVTVCSDSGAQEYKICHCFCFSPSICHEVMGPDAMISIFEC